jgi:hypothetical protein
LFTPFSFFENTKMENYENGGSSAQTVLNWNPNNLEIRTRSVEETLAPLVLQVFKKHYNLLLIN